MHAPNGEENCTARKLGAALQGLGSPKTRWNEGSKVGKNERLREGSRRAAVWGVQQKKTQNQFPVRSAGDELGKWLRPKENWKSKEKKNVPRSLKAKHVKKRH